MQAQHLLIRPIMTEKAMTLQETHNQVTFQVDPRATKTQIKHMVEQQYAVSVVRVQTLLLPGKIRRRSKGSAWKKAVVKVAKGQKIDFFAAA